MLKARKRTLDKEENSTEKRQRWGGEGSGAEILSARSTNSDPISPKMKGINKQTNKQTQAAACMVASDMDPGPENSESRLPFIVLTAGRGQAEQMSGKRLLSN